VGVQLTDAEVWEFVGKSHTGILTTLDREGFPVSLPTWHVVIDRKVYLRTRDAAAKAKRLRRDPRACFLVEGGEHWIDLKAACLVGHAREVTDPALVESVRQALKDKYSGFRQAGKTLPDAVQNHYRRPEVIIEFDADRRTLSWDNRKIRTA